MRPTLGRTTYGKPRFTIGALMITIVVIALVLAALRPLAVVSQDFYPALGELLRKFSTFENGVVLSCLVIGCFVVVKLMSLDEKT